MVAPAGRAGEHPQRHLERHAVLAQGPGRIGRALGGAGADDGIHQQRRDLVGPQSGPAGAGHGRRRRAAVRTGHLQHVAAGGARALDEMPAARRAGMIGVKGIHPHILRPNDVELVTGPRGAPGGEMLVACASSS